MSNSEELQQVSVRIGNGGKVHPGLRSSRYNVFATCSCPGTQNGSARLSVVAKGHDKVNCGQRGK